MTTKTDGLLDALTEVAGIANGTDFEFIVVSALQAALDVIKKEAEKNVDYDHDGRHYVGNLEAKICQACEAITQWDVVP